MAKIETLLQVQSESFLELFHHLPATGWRPDQIRCDWSQGLIFATEHGEERSIYSQRRADEQVCALFDLCMLSLPGSFAVKRLPTSRVGALATLRLSAFMGTTTDAEHDFIAISFGMMRVTLWAKAVANALGSATYLELPYEQSLGSALATKEYWQSKLRAIAREIHGDPMSPVDNATITLWYTNAQHREVDTNLCLVLQNFIVLHEAAHFELGHGDVIRGLRGNVPSYLSHIMEHDADAFALGVFRDLMELEPDVIAPGLSILFSLLALAPSLEASLPECSDGADYPHPLRRLSWILEKVFEGQRAPKSKCLKLSTFIVGIAYRDVWGDKTEAFVDEIHDRLLLDQMPWVPDDMLKGR